MIKLRKYTVLVLFFTTILFNFNPGFSFPLDEELKGHLKVHLKNFTDDLAFTDKKTNEAWKLSPKLLMIDMTFEDFQKDVDHFKIFYEHSITNTAWKVPLRFLIEGMGNFNIFREYPILVHSTNTFDKRDPAKVIFRAMNLDRIMHLDYYQDIIEFTVTKID
jgi:hypothetical protein